jgi:uncharacterized protein (TIGR00645 family)
LRRPPSTESRAGASVEPERRALTRTRTADMARNVIERTLEKGLFASRWLMAPFYVGLVFAIVALMVKFGQELFHLLSHVTEAKESDVVLGVLALIDLSLAANLLLIVTLSGYENFVSKIEIDDHKDKQDWHGKVDFGGLKLKLIASIVAISGIHLLKIFMDIAKYSDRDIFWATIIHVVFVASGVFLALMDKIAGHGGKYADTPIDPPAKS